MLNYFNISYIQFYAFHCRTAISKWIEYIYFFYCTIMLHFDLFIGIWVNNTGLDRAFCRL